MSGLLRLVDAIAERFGHGTTGRSASAEFGRTPASLYPELRCFSDYALLHSDREQLLANIRRDRAERRTKAGTR